MERLVTRNTLEKNQSHSTHCWKIITCSKVYNFKKYAKSQGQGYYAKNVGTHGKVLVLKILR